MYRLRLSGPFVPAQNDIAVLETTVGGLLRQPAAERPAACALIEIGLDGATRREWTYGELLAGPTRLAEALASRFAPGERRSRGQPLRRDRWRAGAANRASTCRQRVAHHFGAMRCWWATGPRPGRQLVQRAGVRRRFSSEFRWFDGALDRRAHLSHPPSGVGPRPHTPFDTIFLRTRPQHPHWAAGDGRRAGVHAFICMATICGR